MPKDIPTEKPKNQYPKLLLQKSNGSEKPTTLKPGTNHFWRERPKNFKIPERP